MTLCWHLKKYFKSYNSLLPRKVTLYKRPNKILKGVLAGSTPEDTLWKVWAVGGCFALTSQTKGPIFFFSSFSLSFCFSLLTLSYFPLFISIYYRAGSSLSILSREVVSHFLPVEQFGWYIHRAGSYLPWACCCLRKGWCGLQADPTHCSYIPPSQPFLCFTHHSIDTPVASLYFAFAPFALHTVQRLTAHVFDAD